MFHPLSSLFKSKKSLTWEKEDVKYFVQNYLRDELNTDSLYCREIVGGKVVVCVSSPALRQEILLLEYDLKEAVKDKTGFQIKEIKITDS